MKENLIKRSITSVFLIIGLVGWMLIGAIYLAQPFGSNVQWSAYTFMAITTILFVIAFYEIINLRKALNWNWIIKIVIIAMAVICLWFPFGSEAFAFYKYNKSWFNFWMSVLLYALCIGVLFLINFTSKNFNIGDVVFIITWGLYLTLSFKGINFLMLQNQNGIQLGWPTMLYLWVIVISNDTGAYLGGMLWGKRPLAPKISPKKTWEGAITGFVLGVVLSVVTVTLLFEVGHYYPLPLFIGDSGRAPLYIAYIGISCILSVTSQFGDLLFSYLKRNHNVKDFSNIFPGHGGLLDRLDSFSAVTIVGFLFTLILLSNH